METSNTRNGRPQPALHYGDCPDRWRSNRQTIRPRALYPSKLVEILGEREGGEQFGVELDISRRGREHRTYRSCGWPPTDQASRLSARAREKPPQRFGGGREVLRARRAGDWTRAREEDCRSCVEVGRS